LNLDTINDLFKLFSDVKNVSIYSAIVQSAMDDITKLLKDSSSSTDERLNYVCASLANLKYQQFMSSRDRLNYTYAGAVSQKHDGKDQLADAYNMFYSYLATVKDIIKDEGFCFKSV
jgi:hypothetical protein